jgi:chloroplastic oxoene reductase
VSEDQTVACPTGIPAADAAGLPLAGLTALQALKAIGTKFDGTGTGANILITAASGGIGTYAVQLGNHHVTATCGTRNMELIRSLGADEVLDYTTEKGAAFKNETGRKYDYVINSTSHGRWSLFKPTLSSNGRVVDLAPCFENYVASITTLFSKQTTATMVMTMKTEDLRFLVALMKEGKIKTVIDTRWRKRQMLGRRA